MRLTRVGAAALWFVLLSVLSLPAGSRAHSSFPPVLEGGFRLFDPAHPARFDAGLVSLGPLVVGGVRDRGHIAGTNQCYEMNFALLGSRNAQRSKNSVVLAQPNHVVVFFVLSECEADFEKVCITQASEAVASRCSGEIALGKNEGRIRGAVNLDCEALDVSAPAFGLSTTSQELLRTALPKLRKGVAIRFWDPTGEEETGEDLDYKIRNFDVDGLDDVVGAFLADDDLPACP
jgi:hypothetical protein